LEWKQRNNRRLLLRGENLDETLEQLKLASQKDLQLTYLQKQYLLESAKAENRRRGLWTAFRGVILLIASLGFLLAALIFFKDSQILADYPTFLRLILSLSSLVLGLFLSIKGWTNLFVKEKSVLPIFEISGFDSEMPIYDSNGENIQPPDSIHNKNVRATASEVLFTAIYPKEGQAKSWQTLLVYAHLLSAIEQVRKDVRSFKNHIPNPKEVTSPSPARIARGTEITVVPFGRGMIFNPERISFKWLEDYHRVEFRFKVEDYLTDDAARAHINIYVGPIIIARLKLTMLVNETKGNFVADIEERCRMYHQDDIFVSYSHKDSPVVLACKKAYEALGFNVLIDIDTLRAGQIWNDELERMIMRSDIFQLFWSQYSSESEYCKKEWQYALKCNKDEGFIRPVYWKYPMPIPPPELSRFHFDYIEFATNEN
jgi:hypothetical protein